MKNENTPTEGENSQKTLGLAGLPGTACCALDLYRLPITGVDTVEDTDQLARRIIHEWTKTRNEYRPDVLMVDLNSDMHLYQMLKAEGLPVAALPEAESRNRRADRNRRYPQDYGTNAPHDSQSRGGPADQAASMPSKTRRLPHSEEKECLMEDGSKRIPAPSHLESAKDTSQAGKRPIRVLWRKMMSLVFGVRDSYSNFLHNE